MPLRMGTPFHTTGESLRTGNETNAGVDPNETKAMRGLIASTRIRRRRRMLTQVSRDLKEPGTVTTRLTVAPGTVTRRASGSVYVVVPHPIMGLRIHRIAVSTSGSRQRSMQNRKAGRSVGQFFAERHGSPNKQRYWTKPPELLEATVGGDFGDCREQNRNVHSSRLWIELPASQAMSRPSPI